MCKAARRHALVKAVLDPEYGRYITESSRLFRNGHSKKAMAMNHETYFPRHISHNSRLQIFRDNVVEADTSLDKTRIANMFADANAVETLNWLALLHMYMCHEGFTLERFQKIMLEHMMLFAASNRAPEHVRDLERILNGYFGIDVRDDPHFMAEVRQQILMVLVPRRMGKTKLLALAIATGMIATNLKLAYFCHEEELCQEVRSAVYDLLWVLNKIILENKMGAHAFPSYLKFKTIKNIKIADKTKRLRVIFNQTDVNTRKPLRAGVPFMTLGNRHVSMMSCFFLCLLSLLGERRRIIPAYKKVYHARHRLRFCRCSQPIPAIGFRLFCALVGPGICKNPRCTNRCR